MSKIDFPLTPEQQAFVAEVHAGRPCWLSARAGTGKTSTIRACFEAGPLDATVIAFNKKNQEDLSKALQGKARITTLHALGFKALRDFRPGLELQSSKLFEATKLVRPKGKAQFRDTMKAVSAAKNWGIIPQGKGLKPGLLPDTPESWLGLVEHFGLWDANPEKARDILQEMNQSFFSEGTLDFDDMVYLPVALGLQVFDSPKMIVDEAQDLSPLNLRMLKKTPAKIWYVGDPYQAIYGWRGAQQGVLESLSLPELPLTTCWRCASAVVDEARRLVPDIKARPGAPEGQVQKLDFMPDWSLHKPGAILARRNSELIQVALDLQRSHARLCILGKDYASTLLGVLETLQGTTQGKLKESLKAWRDKQAEKFPHREGELHDLARALKYFIEEKHGKPAIARAIQELFSDTILPGAWILSTVHKAKGAEWDSVWILDWDQKGLNQPWMWEEDRNLRYVARTRARNFLGIVSSRVLEPQARDMDWTLGGGLD